MGVHLALTWGLGSERNGPVLQCLTLFPVTSSCSTLQCTPPIIPSIWLTLNLIGCCEKHIQSRGRGCSVSADIPGPGGNMFSVGRWLRGDRFSAGASEDATSVARLRGGHPGVTKEGLVILVSQSPAGRLWSRALISTNRFLIRASRAPHTHPPPPLA